ncbi:MAG: four-carbon acid sugar kinase family protein [Eubacteriales bacterium]|nr:four-carbon acid sugar kinase family protein [Eubacteriales bacterium]
MLKASILDTYPKADASLVHELLSREVRKSPCKIIALDDDPTGVQTVHDISVYTDWSEDSIRQGFSEKEKLFFILTNSRSFTKEQTREVHGEIGENLETVADGRPYLLISRSDSTLRGHYPLETEVLRETIERYHAWNFDGEILCPFFAEGGRYTVGDIHYVKYGDDLIPAAETEFARDKTFGYHCSSLPDYVEEKSRGNYRAEEVISISLEDIRAMNFEKIENQLTEARGFRKIVVNAIDNTDVEIFAVALYRAISRGRHFLFRTAAAFVKAVADISDRPLLTRDEMITEQSGRGGVIIIGSHTEKTTRQLEDLRKIEEIRFLEMNSDLVLEGQALAEEAARIVGEIEKFIQLGETVAVYTRRTLLTVENDSKEEALLRSVKISQAVQSVVGNLKVKPAFVLAKGGITSSDIGVKALKVKKARVLGQIQPGIPVWKTDSKSKFPDIPYVIFPGNVGKDDSLYQAAAVLLGKS